MPQTPAVHLPPEDALSTNYAVDRMAQIIASFIGGPDDPDARMLALQGLDQAAAHLNLIGVVLYRRKEVDYTSSSVGGGDYTIATGDQAISFPTDWGWPEDQPVIYDTDGTTAIAKGEWVPWDIFRQTAKDRPGVTGLPKQFSFPNEFNSNIEVYPTLDVSDFGRIRLPYYARVQLPSETQGGDLYMTQETQQALIEGGKAFVMQYRWHHAPNVWMPFWNIFMSTLTKARAAAHRQQDVMHTFAVPDEVSNRWPVPGPVFIRFGS